MWKTLISFLFIYIFLTYSFAESNKKFLSLKNEKVNVRYGPGFSYPIKFVYFKKFLPVQVIDKKENFRRIIDFKKNSGWIHISQLRKVNSLVTLEDKILYSKNSKFSKPIVKIKKGRLVLVKKCIEQWCKIESEDYIGWLNNNNVWGKNN